MSFIYLFFFFILFKNSFNSSQNEKFSTAKILPSGNYFIIIQTGIYIYDSNFKIIINEVYEFLDNEKIENEEDFKKTAITELELNDNFYILSFTKGSLLIIFDNDSNQTNKYTFSDDIYKGCYYSINANIIDDTNIEVFISFVSRETANSISSPPKDSFILNNYLYRIDISLFNITKTISKNKDLKNNLLNLKIFI